MGETSTLRLFWAKAGLGSTNRTALILNAAFAEFADRGFDGASIRACYGPHRRRIAPPPSQTWPALSEIRKLRYLQSCNNGFQDLLF
jgi:hypothetical protein